MMPPRGGLGARPPPSTSATVVPSRQFFPQDVLDEEAFFAQKRAERAAKKMKAKKVAKMEVH
jgi:hypothetical protein